MNEILIEAICEVFKISREEMFSKSRSGLKPYARQVYYCMTGSANSRGMEYVAYNRYYQDKKFREIVDDIRKGSTNTYEHYFGRAVKGGTYYTTVGYPPNCRIEIDVDNRNGTANYRWYNGNYFTDIEKAIIKRDERNLWMSRKSKK